MSRARTLAGAIGSDGALNVADVAGLAAVASSGSASDLATGTLPIARIADGAVANAKLASDLDASKLTAGTLPIARVADGAVVTAKLADSSIHTGKIADSAVTAAKMHTTAVTDKLGYTPANKAGDTFTGAIHAPFVLPSVTGQLSKLGSGSVAAGWYRFARSGNAGANSYGTRGGCRFYVNTQGGWQAPGVTKIELFKDYGNLGSLNVITQGSAAFSDWRLAHANDTTFLEGYTAGFGHGGDIYFTTSLHQEAYGWASGDWTLYTETLTASANTHSYVSRAAVVDINGRRLYRHNTEPAGQASEHVEAGSWRLASAFDNPTVTVLTVLSASAEYSTLIAEVECFQTPWANGAGGNIHSGCATWFNNGGFKTVTSMSLKGAMPQYSVSNVGTLAWSGNALQYTTNRASNYDAYFVRMRASWHGMDVRILI